MRLHPIFAPSALVAALGALTSVSLLYQALIELPSPSSVLDAKLDAVLGLLSALGITLGGYEPVRQERARRAKASQRSRPK
jgi:hypothetical protein